MHDPNSVADSDCFSTKHLHVDWNVDFSRKVIHGSVKLTLQRLQASATDLLLDATALHVTAVHVSNDTKVAWEYDEKGGKFGGCLKVKADTISWTVPEDATVPQCDLVIEYETTTGCTAAQWLAPEQTFGRQHPFMFTQCQAIHARSLLPCQDTPAIKSTYSATVRTEPSLQAVMSANERQDLGNGVFSFQQTTPIPSYLIALGVGNLASREIGPRSVVWSEPEVVDKAAWEFADTEAFISTASELAGPYVWGRYDILLLPPSFPYGGMENPCLTFLTPSLLAGDRSLVDVVAHEIAHSWTGNLVTAANWEHFWLNEGFTMFLERKILGRLHGEAFRQFSALVGLGDLKEALAQFGHDSPATCLCPSLKDTDPDDVFSSVPYEKGHTFLAYLEQVVGGASLFEGFFLHYLQACAYKSITTEDFTVSIKAYFSALAQKGQSDAATALRKLEEEVDWTAWLHNPGPPPVVPDYDHSLFEPCERLLAMLVATPLAAAEAKQLFAVCSLDQKLVLLDSLALKMAALEMSLQNKDALLHFLHGPEGLHLSAAGNVEICLRWYLLAVRSGFLEPVLASVLHFITHHGRMKYNRPLYRELFKAGDLARLAALETFAKHRSFYHPIAAAMIAKDLHL